MKKKLPLSTSTSNYPPGDNNPNGPVTLDWLTLGIEEAIAGIALFLNQGVTNKVYILTGTLTIAGGNYTWSGGYLYYAGDGSGLGKGEVFTVNPSSGSMNSHAYLNAAVDNLFSGADPVIYSDNTPRSPHATRGITFTPASSPSAGAVSAGTGSLPYGLITTLPDATLWVPLNQPQITIVPPTGSGPSYAFRAGYSQNNRLAFWKDAFGLVHIQGDFTSAGTDATGYIFTLPAGYIPANPVYGIMMTTGANYSTYKENVAYFVTIDTSGRVSAGYTVPSDAGNYSLIFQPFTTE